MTGHNVAMEVLVIEATQLIPNEEGFFDVRKYIYAT